MTPYEINRAQTEWSRQLREKVNASKLATETKERMQVVVDWGDYWGLNVSEMLVIDPGHLW